MAQRILVALLNTRAEGTMPDPWVTGTAQTTTVTTTQEPQIPEPVIATETVPQVPVATAQSPVHIGTPRTPLENIHARLCDNGELVKLHLKHYHMSPAVSGTCIRHKITQ